mgnify:CR=1 FL=1
MPRLDPYGQQAQRERAQEEKRFYKSNTWSVARRAYLREHPTCERCRTPTLATVVHHRIPRLVRPDLALTMNNLEALCANCHNRAHPEKGTRL